MGNFDDYVLSDILENYVKQNQILHIGEHKGSSFIFIGTKDEFYEDLDTLEALDIQKTDQVADRVNSDKKHLLKLCRRMTATKLLDRKIMDVYPRIQEDGIIILIEGVAQGSNWFRSDYQKKTGRYAMARVYRNPLTFPKKRGENQ